VLSGVCCACYLVPGFCASMAYWTFCIVETLGELYGALGLVRNLKASNKTLARSMRGALLYDGPRGPVVPRPLSPHSLTAALGAW